MKITSPHVVAPRLFASREQVNASVARTTLLTAMPMVSRRRHLPCPGDAHAQWGTRYYNSHTSAIWALLYYNDEGKPVVKRFPPTFAIILDGGMDAVFLDGRDGATAARITCQPKQTIVQKTARFLDAKRFATKAKRKTFTPFCTSSKGFAEMKSRRVWNRFFLCLASVFGVLDRTVY